MTTISVFLCSQANFTQEEIKSAYEEYARKVHEEDIRYQTLTKQEELEETGPVTNSYEFTSVRVTRPTSGESKF